MVTERDNRLSHAIEDHPIDNLSDESDMDEYELAERKVANRMFYIISTSLLLVLVVLAIWVTNFEDWISLVGGIAANSIAFI